MDRIRIKNLEVFARHGVFPEEHALGQKFLFSADLYLHTRKAGLSDELSASINYGEVCHFIRQFSEEHTCRLLEAAAETLAQELLLAFPLMRRIDLEVSKPWAPIGLPLETVSVAITREWHTVFIALGSNLGDKKGYLDLAVRRLSGRRDCRVKRVASYIETEPYGGVEQDRFLNSALEMETLLPPEELLDVLHEIEAEAERVRLVHWGPRTLDLDILLYDDEIVDTEELHIPHADMARRDFVLIPLSEIAPYRRHPLLNKTIEELRRELLGDS